jgi:hypothetical protein
MIRTFKVGGMRFVQVGQFSMSYCMTRKREPMWSFDRVVQVYMVCVYIGVGTAY